MGNITIAIDGHSSTGKSTAARELARLLSYVYVDTGAMYRAVTLFALQNDLLHDGKLNVAALKDRLGEITITFNLNNATQNADVYLNGKNIEKEIRTLEVSSLVSKVAEISAVREKLVEQQQKMGKEKGIVMDGRDIGSVVFPDAELKVFMTAAPEIRAKRRYDELIERGDTVDYDQVLENVLERDHIDSHRDDSPLFQTMDALLLDTSHMTREKQLEQLVDWSKERMNF
jgi:cytidylate kinase